MNKNMIRQAQKLQAQLQKVQEELETLTVEGTAGGGVIKVVMTGKQNVESVTIEPEAAEELSDRWDEHSRAGNLGSQFQGEYDHSTG